MPDDISYQKTNCLRRYHLILWIIERIDLYPIIRYAEVSPLEEIIENPWNKENSKQRKSA